jgi:hypothetical protein
MLRRVDLGWLMMALVGALGVPAGCGGSAASTNGAGGAGGTAPVAKCTPTNAAPGGGFESCAEGFMHRPGAGTCSLPAQLLRCDPAQSVDVSACATDADCTARANGYCAARGAYPGGLNDPCLCKYSCQSDADCDPGSICLCTGTGGGVCVRASCTTDADCHGTFCASASSDGCLAPPQFHCFSASEGCKVDSDCSPTQYCQFDSISGKRRCAPNGCGAI